MIRMSNYDLLNFVFDNENKNFGVRALGFVSTITSGVNRVKDPVGEGFYATGTLGTKVTIDCSNYSPILSLNKTLLSFTYLNCFSTFVAIQTYFY